MQKLKIAAASIIVLGAFAIILPGFLGYIFGLWRILALIATIVISSWLIVFIYHKLKGKNKREAVPEEPQQEEKK